MAVLTNDSGGRARTMRRAALLALAAWAALVAGCMVFEKLGFIEPPLSFSHARHAEEGLACEDCHFPDEEGGPPGMPAAALCALCHAELDAEKPASRHASALYLDGALRDAGTGQLSDEVVFRHGGHTDMGLECGDCHRGIEASTAVEAALMPRMEDCRRCHGGAGVDPACATCHREIRTDVRPPNHAGAWERLHGTVVRGGSEGAANDCALCHTEGSCNACHQAVPPANHNNLWRLRTHGVVAGMDRENCATCHRSDFCVRCHEETVPLSHKGMWGAPLDKHCLSCHFPLASESCSVCHHGTPSHQQATPLPASHNPGMNCLQCHGLTVPLPHADKGDACITCHN